MTQRLGCVWVHCITLGVGLTREWCAWVPVQAARDFATAAADRPDLIVRLLDEKPSHLGPWNCRRLPTAPHRH